MIATGTIEPGDYPGFSYERRELDKFQVMPPLQAAEYEKLKESIAEQGVLVPVEKDADTGEILDGFHRMRACEELGIKPPVVERRFNDDKDRKIHALTLNLTRRQLGPKSWGDAFRELLETRGVKTGSGARNDSTSATVAEVAKERGVSERTARNRMNLAEDLKDYPEVAEQVDRGEITPLEGRRKVGAAPPKEDAPKQEKPEPSVPKPETSEPKEPTVGESLGDQSSEALDLPPFHLPEERRVYKKIILNLKDIAKLDNERIVALCKGPEEADREIEYLNELMEEFSDLKARFQARKREWSNLRAVK